MNLIRKYLRMIKFSHSIFALPFAGIAFVQALPGSEIWIEGAPAGRFYELIFEVVLCMVTLRSAAMGFNRLVDRFYDEKNPRTADRELPSGVLTTNQVRLFVFLSLAVFITTAFFINRLAGLLSPVAIAAVLGYSYTKRFTMFSHFFLGLADGLAAIASWIAVREEFALLPLLWSFGLMFYIAGFDILYSCQDAEFDREAGLYSMPSRLGIAPAIWISRMSHSIALFLFAWAGAISGTGWIFTWTVAVVGVLFLLEHYLVRPGHLEKIPVAFFNVNASISSILFAGLLLDRFYS